MIRVCVSIPPKTIDEAFSLIRQAETKNADFIEVRLDYLKIHNRIAEIPPYSNTPLIATYKSNKYGNFSGNGAKYKKILIEAAKTGFEYVDVDLFTPKKIELINILQKSGSKVIVSFHDFTQTPPKEQLSKILEEEIAIGADVCKIITTARSIRDNLTILDFVLDASKQTKLICFAMADLGKVSRVFSPVWGAFFTFASLDSNKKTAEGQLTIKQMKLVFEALGLK